MTRDEILQLPPVVDVVTIGRIYGIGRDLAYDLARRGEFPVPVLRLGRGWRVRTAHVLADLGLNSSEAAAPTAALANPDPIRPQSAGAA